MHNHRLHRLLGGLGLFSLTEYVKPSNLNGLSWTRPFNTQRALQTTTFSTMAHATSTSSQESLTAQSNPSPEIHSRFLNLPTELRLHIYEFLFASLTAVPNPFLIKESELINATAILHTSPQLFEEASSVFLRYRRRFGVVLAMRDGTFTVRAGRHVSIATAKIRSGMDESEWSRLFR